MRVRVRRGATIALAGALMGVAAAAGQLIGDGGDATRPSVTVVIDPGHGGDEPGAIGVGGTEEKQIVLAVAEALRAQFVSRGGFHVILTRDEDRRLTTDERASAANANKADVFISLHVNASPSPATSGPEVTFWGGSPRGGLAPAPGDGGALVPMLAGGAKRVDVRRWNAAQTPHLARSAALAERVGERLRAVSMLGPRGISPGPMRVLASIDAAAVLIELGYLSNVTDDQMLAQEAHQATLAQAIADAVESMTGARR